MVGQFSEVVGYRAVRPIPRRNYENDGRMAGAAEPVFRFPSTAATGENRHSMPASSQISVVHADVNPQEQITPLPVELATLSDGDEDVFCRDSSPEGQKK